MRKKTLIRRIYNLGSRTEILAERAVASLFRKLQKK